MSAGPVRVAAALLALSAIAPPVGSSPQSTPTPEIHVVRPDHALDDDPLPNVEPHLAVDPNDPARLLVGAIRVAPDRGRPWTCVALSSRDRGSTWRRHELVLERCIDPWVTFADDGTALLSLIELGDREAPTMELSVYRSSDGGERWEDRPVSFGGGHEHPHLLAAAGVVWLAARRMDGPPGSARHEIVVYRSTADGRSFDLVDAWPLEEAGLDVTGLVRLADGSLGVGVQATALADRTLPAAQRRAPRTGMLALAEGALGEPLWIAGDCGNADAFPGYPSLAAGAEGRRLAHACIRADLDGVAVTTSDDGGRSWSEPTRVDGAVSGAGHARTAMVAVDDRGTIGVAWYDRSADPERRCQRILFTASTDAGRSFAPPVAVGSEPSCPEGEANGSVAASWAMGGDYSSLIVSPDGDFHLVWADARDGGPFGLRHAALMVTPGR